MEPVLAQSSNSTFWLGVAKIAIPVLFVVIASIAKKMNEKAAERKIDKNDRKAQAALEMEAIRTGKDIEQVLSGRPAETSHAHADVTALPDSNDPKVRRERQLAELRRRAAARGGQPSQATPQPQPHVRQPTPAQPVRIQLPGGGSVVVGQTQSQPRPASRPTPGPAPRPQAKPVQQRPQKMTNEQAARAARDRQAVPTRVQNTQVSDMAGSSDTHRLVADTDAAKVTARAGRKGPKLGRAGLRQAMMMSEIFGKPRSERLDEI